MNAALWTDGKGGLTAQAPRHWAAANQVETSTAWPEDRVALLKKLWIEGELSCAGIAKAMGGGVTRSSVGAKVRRLDLPRRPRPESKKRVPRERPVRAFTQPRGLPRPPRVIIDPMVFAPLPGTAPRPFSQRRTGQCSWPIGEGADTLSCCGPVTRGGWCEPHAVIGFQAPSVSPARAGRDLIRSLRRVL